MESQPTPARRTSDRNDLLDVAVYLLRGFIVYDQMSEELFLVVEELLLLDEALQLFLPYLFPHQFDLLDVVLQAP
jgi:hypothetical protein